MAKRLGVARALVVEPEILFYDEPTTGLDRISSRKVDELIEEMREKFFITSTVITHDMASAFRDRRSGDAAGSAIRAAWVTAHAARS